MIVLEYGCILTECNSLLRVMYMYIPSLAESCAIERVKPRKGSALELPFGWGLVVVQTYRGTFG